jgi:hypothetical protein
LLEPLIGDAVDIAAITGQWSELVRLKVSIKTDGTLPSVILRNLAAAGPGNALSRALRAVWRIERTLFTLQWLSDPELRQRSNARLNNREASNSLRHAVFFHRQGEIRDRTFENQSFRASGPSMITAAIVQHQLTPVGCWQMDVDHLNAGEFFQSAACGQARRQRLQAALQGDLQAVSQEGDEDVRYQHVIARYFHRSQFTQPFPQPFQLPPAHCAFLGHAVDTFGKHVNFAVLQQQFHMHALPCLDPGFVNQVLLQPREAAFWRAHQILHQRVAFAHFR